VAADQIARPGTHEHIFLEPAASGPTSPEPDPDVDRTQVATDQLPSNKALFLADRESIAFDVGSSENHSAHLDKAESCGPRVGRNDSEANAVGETRRHGVGESVAA
jgi:hypothetical protein